ncbi:c-type cytochrome [Bosea beijingensis]|uniref:c-type cytochrome n=1 Tax=Bosea beijingensis TaxID=3068632 RepID=UPI0027425024|nr:c-type cytochrome [Bosea sp. REN20]
MSKQTAPDCYGAHAAGRYGLPNACRSLRILALAGVTLVLGWGPAEAAGNEVLGRYLSAECTACHQLSGKSVGGIPAIIGWPEDQFAAVLASYGRKERGGQVMQAIAAKLSPDDMTALAAYFGALSPKP